MSFNYREVAAGTPWKDVGGGGAVDIGGGSFVHVISNDGSNKINYIEFSKTSNSMEFHDIHGTGTSIAGGGNGVVYAVSTSGKIYVADGWGRQWRELLGENTATEIGANSDSTTGYEFCYVGPHDPVTGGGGRVYCNVDSTIQEIGDGSARLDRIDVMSNGLPIGVNTLGNMYKAVQNANTNVVTWEEIGTGYKDCAVGPNNRIWGIKKDDNTIIFDVGGPDEQQVEGEATKIAVDHYNVAWVIGGDDDVNGGQVYKYIGRLSIWDAPPAKFQTRRYRFQKKNGSNNWRNTDYLWCVQEPFFPSIGDLEVYDNDRIVDKGHDAYVACENRFDIGDCVYDSTSIMGSKLYKC